jgi:16S rRNA G527 N7-methylase RsmG
VNTLGISNVKVVWGRAEDMGRDISHREVYDVALARAVADLRVLSELCLPFVRPGGIFLAAKGTKPESEIEAAENAIKMLGGQLQAVQTVESYSEVDGMARTAVIIRKTAATPSRFPRRAGRPVKQPL